MRTIIHAILSSGLLAVGSLSPLLASTTRAAPSSPIVPEAVQAVTRQQIKTYFGTNSMAGVPLVDPRVDWLSIKNWPDEFQFLGETYQIHFEEWHGDYTKPLESRSAIREGMSFLATYRVKGTSSGCVLTPTAIWRPDGSVGHRELNWRDKKTRGIVFTQQFGPKGRLLIFACTDEPYTDERSQYCIQYYSPSGK